MADVVTVNFGLTKPDVGASDDTWGEKLNDNFQTIDTEVAPVNNPVFTGSVDLADPIPGYKISGSIILDSETNLPYGTYHGFWGHDPGAGILIGPSGDAYNYYQNWGHYFYVDSPTTPILGLEPGVVTVIGADVNVDGRVHSKSVTVGPTAPSSPAVNDIWIDTT